MTSDRLEIFVGADRSQLMAVPVLEFSIKRHASRPVRVTSMHDLGLPEPKDVRQGPRTNFSFTRFAIPGLMGHNGMALYLDADMLVFRDIAEIWTLPMGEAKILIQAEVDPRAQAPKAGAPAQRIKQCSVMLMDCARLDWDAARIIAGLDGRYTYEQLLYEMCILDEAEIAYALPFRWNSLEHYDAATCLLHYTDMHTQPWVDPFNRLGFLWMDEVRLMIDCGLLRWRELEREVELGYFRPSLIPELRNDALRGRWDAGTARRYAAIDARAGFVKHPRSPCPQARARGGGEGLRGGAGGGPATISALPGEGRGPGRRIDSRCVEAGPPAWVPAFAGTIGSEKFLRRDHPLHLGDDLAQVDGLGEDPGARGGAVAGGQGHGGEAGDEHDPQAHEPRGGLAGDLDAVDARHDDVGEQEVPAALVQRLQRLLAVGAGPDVIAGALQGPRQEPAQGIVVFGQEDTRHGRNGSLRERAPPVAREANLGLRCKPPINQGPRALTRPVRART